MQLSGYLVPVPGTRYRELILKFRPGDLPHNMVGPGLKKQYKAFANGTWLRQSWKRKQFFPAVEFEAVSRSGGLQADLLGGLGAGAPSGKREVTFCM